MDLWAWDGEDIKIFDYKSSESQSHHAEKQLIFYSWILEEIYHPRKIQMYVLYPFQKKITSYPYKEEDKNLFENWLSSQTK